MNESACQPKAKKTLMNAVERLSVTANRLDDLSNFSELLVAKFERTEDVVRKGEMVRDKECGGQQPDIIDLFNSIDDRLNYLLNKIGSNIEKVVSMID